MLSQVPTLSEVSSGRNALLSARSVIGRLPTCQLRIGSSNVSAVHAQITWDGNSWQVRDLGSRNGTFVNDRRIATSEHVPLSEGTIVSFGAPTHRYRLLNASPPRLMATRDSGTTIVSEGEHLYLPTDDACPMFVFRDSSKHWVLSTPSGERPIQDQEIITAGNHTWRIGLPGLVARTNECAPEPGPDHLREAQLSFAVSRDGEHVTAKFTQAGVSTELEYRAHLFLLLQLARARIADAAQAHLPSSEHGWMYRDEVLSALAIDETHLNIWVYRARRQFMEANIPGAGTVLERRAATRQLRIGIERLCIA